MGKMKNFGTSETMQTLMRKSVCALLSLLLLLSAMLPVKAAAETAPVKVVRVGSFEDTFNYCNEKGARKGYGYELLETLSGYTGWQFEYVTCDWSDCFEKLENGEIDIMGGISYTEDRAEEMLFSDEPMGEEKYYLYADLSRADISASDFKILDGKKIGVVMGTEPEVMLTEWEEKHGIKTQHVNISNNEDVKQKLANHEIDCFVSLEESYWAELGISTITRVGKSSILNALEPDFQLKTGEISTALGRGRHTTRHVELFRLSCGAEVVDSPGFSSFETEELNMELKQHLPETFREFRPYLGKCRFLDCSHTREQGCAVLDALKAGNIQASRHRSYLRLYEELKPLRDWQEKRRK